MGTVRGGGRPPDPGKARPSFARVWWSGILAGAREPGVPSRCPVVSDDRGFGETRLGLCAAARMLGRVVPAVATGASAPGDFGSRWRRLPRNHSSCFGTQWLALDREVRRAGSGPSLGVLEFASSVAETSPGPRGSSWRKPLGDEKVEAFHEAEMVSSRALGFRPWSLAGGSGWLR